MESSELLTTNRKALTVNLDEARCGTFAEIGARPGSCSPILPSRRSSRDNREVDLSLRHEIQHAIYGKAARYVSRERLGLMLDHEYDLLIERLNAVRGDRTAFFVFADTVAAKSFKGTNERLDGRPIPS